MKRKLTKTDLHDEEDEIAEIPDKPIDLKLRDRKERPKRDGCMAGNATTSRHGKPKARPSAPEGAAAPPLGGDATTKLHGRKKTKPAAAEGGAPSSEAATGLYGDTAVTIHKIPKNAKLTSEDVERRPRTSANELTYQQVLEKRASQDIAPNETVKKGMVK